MRHRKKRGAAERAPLIGPAQERVAPRYAMFIDPLPASWSLSGGGWAGVCVPAGCNYIVTPWFRLLGLCGKGSRASV